MRSRKIISIVAFVAAFGFSAAFAGLFATEKVAYSYSSTSYCKHQQQIAVAASIENLIAADAANGTILDRKIYAINETDSLSFESVAFADYARAVEGYVDDSSSLSQDNLPSDFKCAWREHLKAWRNSSTFLNVTADISRNDSLSAEEFEEANAFHSREINRTFGKVIEIGNRYGADVH